MPKPLRFRQRLDRYPPILVRLLTSRGRGKAKTVPTDRQIAETSGLPIAEVKRLSFSTDWSDVKIDTMYRFLAGCDIDLEKRRTFRRLEDARRFGTFSHLRRLKKNNDPQWAQFEEMLATLTAWTDGEA